MPIDASTLERIKKNDPSLTSLGLSSKELTDANIFVLCQALEINDKLTKLIFHHKKIENN